MSKTFQFGNGEWAIGKETVLAYNDENNNFKPLPFTFDRGSIATVVNKDGLIETVGIDEPRIDFLNNTKGHLLLEPSRQNIVTYSEDFSDSSWSKSQSSATLSNITSPKGTQNVYKFTENTASSKHQLFTTISSYTELTISFFAKKEERSFIAVEKSGWGNTIFNLNTGSVVSGTGDVIDFGNGWFRCSASYTASPAQTQFYLILMQDSDTNNYQGDGNSGLYLWGIQAEVGSYATSYIPTSGQSGGVTRSAENIALTFPDNASFNSSNGFSLYGEFLTNGGSGTSVLAVQFNGNTGYFGFGSNGTNWRARVNNGTDNELHNSSASILSVGKLALSFDASGFSMYANGTSFASGNTDISAITSTENIFFRDNTEEFGSLQIRELKLYNDRLSDSELQALTS